MRPRISQKQFDQVGCWPRADLLAGVVLGTAVAIKMIAYVGMSPIASAFVDVLPRRTFATPRLRGLLSLNLAAAAAGAMAMRPNRENRLDPARRKSCRRSEPRLLTLPI